MLAAANHRADSGSHRALGELIQAYWYPLYAFVRRQGEGHQAAEDLVQEFFTRVMEKQYLAQVDRSRGKFRSFLLASIKHFMSKQRHHQRAKKRGGGHTIVPLDGLDAGARYAVEPADSMTPERLFERQWALTVLDLVMRRLADEYAAASKSPLFAEIAPALTQPVDYAQIAQRLGFTESGVRVAVHRLRRRYRDLLRQEIADTVESPDEVAAEIAYLLDCL